MYQMIIEFSASNLPLTGKFIEFSCCIYLTLVLIQFTYLEQRLKSHFFPLRILYSIFEHCITPLFSFLPLIPSFPFHPTLVFFFVHQAHFMLFSDSLILALLWCGQPTKGHTTNTTAKTATTKTYFSSSHNNQILIFSQLVLAFYVEFLGFYPGIFAWLELIKVLCMLAKSLWVHICIWYAVSRMHCFFEVYSPSLALTIFLPHLPWRPLNFGVRYECMI